MTSRLLNRSNVAQDQYVRALSAAYRKGGRVPDPDLGTATEPELWDKIRRDPVIAHVITFRRHLVAGSEFNVEAKGTKSEDEQASLIMGELLECMDDLPEARFMLAESIFRGSSYAFIEGKRKVIDVAGLGPMEWWVPTRLRHVDRYRFRMVVDEETGGIRWEFWSVFRSEWEELPPSRLRWFVRHVYEESEDSLGHGRGLLETLYNYAWVKEELFQDLMMGVDRWAGGIVVAKIASLRDAADDQTNQDLASAWRDILRNGRSEHYYIHGADDELVIHTGGMEGHQIVTNTMTYVDRAITRAVLGSVLPTGGDADAPGSFARAKVEEGSTDALAQFDARKMDSTLTRDVIGLTWRMNINNWRALGLAGARLPVYRTVMEPREDPAEEAGKVATLLGAGVELLAEDVYGKTGFKQPAEGEDVITAPEPEAPEAGGGLPGLPFTESPQGGHGARSFADEAMEAMTADIGALMATTNGHGKGRLDRLINYELTRTGARR